MNPFYRNFLTSVAILLILPGWMVAQNCSEDETDFSTYYHQKKSLFEELENDPGEIIFLGDSITDGNEWAEMFGDSSIKNRGISGDITLGVLCRMDEVVESGPDKVFIMIGINDLAREISVEEILSNYEEIVAAIVEGSQETELFIQSLLPVNPDFEMFDNHMKASDKVADVNEGLREIAEENNATYIDLYTEFSVDGSKLNPDFTNDGLHLTGEGYIAWKALIEEYVTD